MKILLDQALRKYHLWLKSLLLKIQNKL